MDFILELKDADLNQELDEIANDLSEQDDEPDYDDQYDYYDYQYERYEKQLDTIVSTSDLTNSIQGNVTSETIQDKRYINNFSSVSGDNNDHKTMSTESADNATVISNTLNTTKPKNSKVKKTKKTKYALDENVDVVNESLQLKPEVPSTGLMFNIFSALSTAVSGTMQTFNSVNNFVTSPIVTLFQSSDKVKEKILKESYDNLINYSLMHGVTILLREGIIVMDSFQCNFDSGSIVKDRLIEIIILFGNNTDGILKYITTMSASDKDKSYDIKPKHITAFVSILASYLRYFIKFTRDNCLYYTLACGADVKQKFSSFMKHTTSIINDISIDIEYDKYFTSRHKNQVTEDGKVIYLKQHEPFNIVCDVKVAVNEVHKDSKLHLMDKMTTNNWSPSELVKYARELEEASILVADLTNRALSLTSDFCGFNICSNYHNLALKHFWNQNIGEHILLGTTAVILPYKFCH